MALHRGSVPGPPASPVAWVAPHALLAWNLAPRSSSRRASPHRPPPSLPHTPIRHALVRRRRVFPLPIPRSAPYITLFRRCDALTLAARSPHVPPPRPGVVCSMRLAARTVAPPSLDPVKMEDRKRPIADDSAPPAKRQAVTVNGARSHADADLPWKDDIEVRLASLARPSRHAQACANIPRDT